MRKYAPFYDSHKDKWHVIAWDDDGTGYWFNEHRNVGSESAAKTLADALNARGY